MTLEDLAQGRSESNGGQSSSLQGFGGLQGLSGFKSPVDISTSEGLLEYAKMQGGSLSEAAEELAHPTRGILSTISTGFKSAFRGFIDVISVPSQVIAGVISPSVSVGQAIDENISPSDVIFGKPNPNASTMQKVGNFVVRTATDILLDPLTYVSFGASQGILGLSSAKKIAATEALASITGKEIGAKVALSEAGEELFNKGVQAQINGLRNTALKEGGIDGLTGKNLERFVQETISSKLDKGFVETSFANMIAAKPQLAETLLDKGGIKFFGKTMLSGQRVSSAIQAIPGMTMVDNVTAPLRNSIGSLFDSSLSASGRLPNEVTDILQKYKDLHESNKIKSVTDITNAWKTLKITGSEDELVRAAIELDKMPTDPRLAQLWKTYKGVTKSNLRTMWDAGYKVTEIPNYVPHFLVDEPTKTIPFTLPPSTSLKHAQQASIAKFINRKTGEELIGKPELLKLTPKFREQEIKAISQRLDSIIEKKSMDVSALNNEVEDLVVRVDEFFKGKASGEFEKILDDLPIQSRDNFRLFMEKFKENLDPVDVNSLVEKRLKSSYKAGIKAKAAVRGLSEEALLMLEARLKQGEETLPVNIKDVREALSKFTAETRSISKKSSKSVDAELKALAEKLREDSLVKRGGQIMEGLDKDAIAKFIQPLREQFMEDPAGVKGMLDSIIGRQQKITDVLSEVELEKLAAKTDINALPEQARFFQGEDGEMFERVRATVEDAEKIGVHFDKSGISTLVRSSLNVNKATTMREMITELSRKAGVAASRAPDGWVGVSVKGLKDESIDFAKFSIGKEGEQLYFHPEVAKRIENFMGSVINDEATNKLLQNFDKLQNIWKASVTSVFPAFHGRNAISNVFLNFLDLGMQALNPAKHMVSADLLVKDGQATSLANLISKGGQEGVDAAEKFTELMSKEMFTDRTGYSWTFGELRRTIREKNIAFNPNITGSLDTAQTSKEFIEELLPSTDKMGIAKQFNPLSPKFKPFQVGRKVGGYVEQQARILNFISNLEKTGDPILAAQRTKQFLFDYGNLTPFEKTFMRRIIPFYTFTRKNIELQARTLLTTPGRVAAEMTAISTLGDVLSGEKLSDKEQSALPDWVKNGVNILKSKKGSTVEILGGLGTPVEQPFQALQPNQILGSISPLLRVPVEQATGYSFFQGKALSDVTNASGFKHAPKFLKDFIGYTEVDVPKADGTSSKWYVSLRPGRMSLINNLPPTSRVLSSLKQLENADTSDASKIMQQLVGTRVFSFDLEKEAKKRELELKQKLEKLLTDAKATKQFTRTYVPN